MERGDREGEQKEPAPFSVSLPGRDGQKKGPVLKRLEKERFGKRCSLEPLAVFAGAAGAGGAALAGFETGLRLADHVEGAFTFDQLAVGVTGFG